jgi:hypothetical protein
MDEESRAELMDWESVTRMVVEDCENGHGKKCHSRPWAAFSSLYCVCDCHRRLRYIALKYWRRNKFKHWWILHVIDEYKTIKRDSDYLDRIYGKEE